MAGIRRLPAVLIIAATLAVAGVWSLSVATAASGATLEVKFQGGREVTVTAHDHDATDDDDDAPCDDANDADDDDDAHVMTRRMTTQPAGPAAPMVA